MLFLSLLPTVTCLLLAALPASEGTMAISHLSTVYLPYTYEGGSAKYGIFKHAADIATYDPDTKMIYATGGKVLHAIDASDPKNLKVKGHMEVTNQTMSDVVVCGGHVFVSYKDLENSTVGGVMQFRLYDEETGTIPFVRTIAMGPVPDKILPTKDCTIVVTIENYPHIEDGRVDDPPGGVGIISFPDGLDKEPALTTLDFTAFDDKVAELQKSGLRWIYRESKLSDDLEPEWVTFNADQTTAYVSLQENNAIAVVDLRTPEITGLFGLGQKDWSQYKLDPSDQDGGINMAPWGIYGMYMPDSIEWFEWQGEGYIVTANEGARTDVLNFTDNIRGVSFSSSDIADSVPEDIKAAVADVAKLGRLYMSPVDGLNAAGQVEKFHSLGCRSFSIFKASDMSLVFDSGSQLSEKTIETRQVLFNNWVRYPKQKVAGGMDYLSDDYGEKPESVVVTEIGGRLYFLICLEEPGLIAVYSMGTQDNLTPQFESLFTGGIPEDSDQKNWEQLYEDKSVYMLDLESISVIDSDGDTRTLLVTASDSGSVSLLQLAPATSAAAKTSGADSLVLSSSSSLLLLLMMMMTLLRF